MTTTPQAALLREAAQNALITLDGIASANPRDKADFETPSEWIAWAKSRARFAADALREPISREVYAERILKQMLREASEPQTEKKCGTCGFIGQEDPVKGCPKCGFDDMRDKLQATQAALLSDEEIMRNWSGGACPDWAIKFVRACFAAQHAKLQATQAEPVQAGELPDEREAQKSSLLVLCAIRDLHEWHPNMLKDIDFAIHANRAALSARKPLTDEQINQCRLSVSDDQEGRPEPWAYKRGWRDAERAHGIGLEVKP